MNKVMMIGRLTRDVEMHYSANGNNTAVARYTLAVNRPRTQDGNQDADFLRCVAFGKTAELAEKYLGKGTRVSIEGHLRTGSYTNREGQKVYTTDIVVERHGFLEKRTDSNTQPPYPSPDAAQGYNGGYMAIPDGTEEELPFS